MQTNSGVSDKLTKVKRLPLFASLAIFLISSTPCSKRLSPFSLSSCGMRFIEAEVSKTKTMLSAFPFKVKVGEARAKDMQKIQTI